MLRTGTEYTEPTPQAITGAVIDETQVAVTLHVDPVADPGGDGTELQPLRDFEASLPLVREILQAGRGVRVLLAEGVYREGFSVGDAMDDWSIVGNQLGEAAVAPPLVFEAAAGARVIFDGTDPFPLSEWESAGQTAAGAPIYRRPLPVELPWDRKHYGAHNPRLPLGYRPELAFIGDAPLRQVMLEQYPDVPTRGRGRSPGTSSTRARCRSSSRSSPEPLAWCSAPPMSSSSMSARRRRRLPMPWWTSRPAPACCGFVTRTTWSSAA
jgi:hypothetical protein